VITLGQGYTYAERLQMSIKEASKKKPVKKETATETKKEEPTKSKLE
tara:strand:- start:49 stop:189 length:141 start_codon:yes stop_codon:yes gene_type:complete